jgi:predicted ester cyclase
MSAAAQHDYAARARQAIEVVCSGELARIGEFDSPDFVDHVNDTTYYGHEGGRESVGFYRRLLTNPRFTVEEQVSQANRVASRWTLHGAYHGRAVALPGITIGTFDDEGRIREDHSQSDSMSVLRQLGAIRALALGIEILTGRIRIPRGNARPKPSGGPHQACQ